MFTVKAYSVRLALDRNSQRPSATAHFTCRMPCLPPFSCRPLCFGPVVHRRDCRHLIPKGLDRVVFRLPFDLVRCLHHHVDPYPTAGCSNQGLANAGNPVNGVADQGDAFRGRIQHLQDGLLRAAKRHAFHLGAGPHQLHRLALTMNLFGLCRRQQAERHFLGRKVLGTILPAVQEIGGDVPVVGVRNVLGDPCPGLWRSGPRRLQDRPIDDADHLGRQSSRQLNGHFDQLVFAIVHLHHSKKARSARSTVSTNTDRSRYLLPRSQDVSGTKVQA